MSYKIKVLHKLDLEVKNSWEEFESKSYNYCFQNYEWFLKNNKRTSFDIFQIFTAYKFQDIFDQKNLRNFLLF